MNSSPPQVTFFVESREESATEMAKTKGSMRSRGEFLLDRLGGGDVITGLQTVRGRVAVAIDRREISDDLAMVDFLRELNILDVEVDVWPTLRDEDGYWIHAGNVRTAYEKVIGIVEALEKKGVSFKNIGLDLEFSIGLMKDASPMAMLRQLMKMKPWQFSQLEAKLYLANLVEEILRVSDYGVHTYEVPILGDNSRLRRLLGIPEAPMVAGLKDDDRVLHEGRHKRVGLVYTSATPKIAMGDPEKFVREYSAGRGRIPALGIVSASGVNPGRNLGSEPHLLTDDELTRDMRAALTVSPREVFVFALNGKSVVDRTRAAIEAALGMYSPVHVEVDVV